MKTACPVLSQIAEVGEEGEDEDNAMLDYASSSISREYMNKHISNYSLSSIN